LKHLPVVETIRAALLLVWQRRFMLIRALAVMGVALTAIDFAQRYFLRSTGSLWVAWLGIVVSWFAYTLFAVTCHRIVLLGETSVPRYGLLSWTSRETRFFGWGALLSVFCLIALVPLGILAWVVGYFADIPFKGYERYWVYLWGVPLVYGFARLAVLFPATAVGERRNTDWALATTAGNGWRIVFATILAPAIPGLALNALPYEDNFLLDFLLKLLDYAFVAIGIAALSLSFRFLSSPEESVPSA